MTIPGHPEPRRISPGLTARPRQGTGLPGSLAWYQRRPACPRMVLAHAVNVGGWPMWRRQLTGTIVLVAGVVMLAGGIVDHAFAAPKAALCGSGIGQIGQAFDNTVAHDCGLVTALESAVGWLIVAGILAVLLGIAILVNSRLAKRPGAAPIPGAAPMPGVPPRSATPPASPAPPTPPASRPWWDQS
jgi:hypothetical protein